MTGHGFAGVREHGPIMCILSTVLGDTQAPHASHAEPDQWNALRRPGSNSASAKAGLYCLSALSGTACGHLTGLVWTCHVASSSRFPIHQTAYSATDEHDLSGRDHVECMSPAVLTRLGPMRLAVVAQHLHIADVDRIPAVKCDGSAENGRRISPKTIVLIRELVYGA